MKKLLSVIIAFVLATFAFTGCSMKNNTDNENPVPSADGRVKDNRNLTPAEYTMMNTVGTDALGRYFTEAAGYKTDTKYVGIWYSLWLGQHTEQQAAIYDNSKLLSTEEGKAALESMTDNELSKVNEFHFCAEPLYGYYNMNDKWIVTRHMELLTMAGIDYLCFDTTNSVIYADVAKLVIETLLEFQKQGFKVPKVMFYTNSHSGTTAKKIYETFYQTEKYNDIWFSPNGKPLIAGITRDNGGASDQLANAGFDNYMDESLADRFEIVESQWPQGWIKHDNAIPWMDWDYPQNIHKNYGAISVSVAQHGSTIQFSDMEPRSSKGYNHKTGEIESYVAGANFETEWESVFDYEAQGKKIKNVMVTGWNEWMAIKYTMFGRVTFCDVYNDEYSRDIEPSAGVGGDNFYMQLARNIRKYKLTDRVKYKYQKMTMDIDNEDSLFQWEAVKAHYVDFAGDAIERNGQDAVKKGRYTDNSNRNDITDVKVVHNNSDLFVYVKTKDDITAYNGADKNWMTLLIGATENNNGFNGYDYIINRSPKTDGTTSIEKSTGGYNWANAGSADYRVYGNVIVYKIPLATLGLTADNCHIVFKVTDNVTKPDDIMNYYVSGDCAPIGRLSYSYGY